MDLFLKTSAMVLVTVVLSLFLGKTEKDMAVLLGIVACCMAGAVAIHYLDPVFAFLCELVSLSSIQNDTLKILIKVVGIAMLAEIVGSICSDSGNGSLGKMLNLLGTGVILYLSIPVFEILTKTLSDIMGEL